MFITASTKEFTLVNNAIPSYEIAFEELLYYRLAPPILWSWHIANLYTYKTLVTLIDWLIEAVRTNPGYGMAILIYNFWDFWELFFFVFARKLV